MLSPVIVVPKGRADPAMTEPSLLGAFSVSPSYSQVSVGDSGCTDYPHWETGNEEATAVADCVAVSTREDRFGPVDIEVYVAEGVGHRFPGYRRVYSDQLEIPSGVILIGSVAGADEHAFQISERRPTVNAWVNPPDAPSSLKILVTQPGQTTRIPAS